MPSNDDDSGKAAAPSDSTASFNNNFFPESRPPNTITSSVHKKFNLVEAITTTISQKQQQQGHSAEMSLIDRVLAWAFEILIIGLLIVLIHKFVRRAMQERNVMGVKDEPPQKNAKHADEMPKSNKVLLVHSGGARIEKASEENLSEKRDTLRFKSKDLKYVKKRKWVSTGPIMAHGRDLSLSPDKKLMNLRFSNILGDAHPMFNPIPLLKDNKKEEEKNAQKVLEKPKDESKQPEIVGDQEEDRVLEVKLHIPVQVTVENIYNFKNFNVCFICIFDPLINLTSNKSIIHPLSGK